MRQTGARYIQRQTLSFREKDVVCVQHYMTDSELIRVSKNVVKRVRKGDK